MSKIEPYIIAIISILGVAYPLLLQVIARIDEKYSTDKIIDLFNQEWESKAFLYSLISSLVFIVIWSIDFPPIQSIDRIVPYLENSASFLLAFNAILLVFFFFFFIRKIQIYYVKSKFIPYLIKKHEKG